MEDLEIDLVTAASGRAAEEEVFAERIRLRKVPVNNRDPHHATNRELLTYAARALGPAARLHRARPYDLAMAWHTVPAGAVAFALKALKGLCYLVRVGGADIPGFERRYRFLYPLLSPVLRLTWSG